MLTNTAMRWNAFDAQDETAVQHKPQCILAWRISSHSAPEQSVGLKKWAENETYTALKCTFIWKFQGKNEKILLGIFREIQLLNIWFITPLVWGKSPTSKRQNMSKLVNLAQ